MAQGYDADKLCNEWVAYSNRAKLGRMDMEGLDQLEAHLQKGSHRKTAASSQKGSKSRSQGVGGLVMSQENLDEL